MSDVIVSKSFTKTFGNALVENFAVYGKMVDFEENGKKRSRKKILSSILSDKTTAWKMVKCRLNNMEDGRARHIILMNIFWQLTRLR
jgi:hypothetical protein